MDLNLLKSKLEALNNSGKKEQKEKIDYSKFFWKPQPGKYQIRIIPSKFDANNPFKEVFFHYGFTKYPILALNNWGEKDPIIEFSTELRNTREKENYLLANKIKPKMRIFVPIIVRGEENKGVRLWEFGNSIYKLLLGLASDEDYGDFTDIKEGRDFTVEVTKKDVLGREINSCEVRIKPKTSQLSSNNEEIQKWLSEQPDILEINSKKSFEDIKKILTEWLEQPSSSSESDKTSENGDIDASTVASKVSTNIEDKFSKLFENK